MLGFAILIFGMDVMSDAMKPLAATPEFQAMFVHFSNPFLGVLTGAVLTALIQSSSASVGILQALTATGIVSMSAAIPIIMGQNIGTCITAALAAIGAKRNAKRASAIHLSFNLIGTIIFMIVFYVGDYFFSFAFMDQLASPVSIAVMHSIFNIVNTLILINFTGLLTKIAYLFIPETETERREKFDEFQTLDDRLLETPPVAIRQAWQLTTTMFEKSLESFNLAVGLFNEYDQEVFDDVQRLEKQIDRFQDRLGGFLLKIVSREITTQDNRAVTIILNSISDIERISDHAYSLANGAKRLHNEKLHFSDLAMTELNAFSTAVRDVIRLTIEAFRDEDMAKAKLVEPLEEVIDHITEVIKLRHIERLRLGVCSIETGLLFTDISNSLERISDHCSNIAVTLIEIPSGSHDAHKYLRRLRKDTVFQDNVDRYLEKYALPQVTRALAEECCQSTVSAGSSDERLRFAQILCLCDRGFLPRPFSNRQVITSDKTLSTLKSFVKK